VHSVQVEAVTVLHNETAVHSLPVAIHLLSRAQLGMIAPLKSIEAFSQPWPELVTEAMEIDVRFQVLMVSLSFGTAIVTMMDVVASNIVSERLVCIQFAHFILKLRR